MARLFLPLTIIDADVWFYPRRGASLANDLHRWAREPAMALTMVGALPAGATKLPRLEPIGGNCHRWARFLVPPDPDGQRRSETIYPRGECILRWEYSHAASAVLTLLALVALIFSIVS